MRTTARRGLTLVVLGWFAACGGSRGDDGPGSSGAPSTAGTASGAAHAGTSSDAGQAGRSGGGALAGSSPTGGAVSGGGRGGATAATGGVQGGGAGGAGTSGAGGASGSHSGDGGDGGDESEPGGLSWPVDCIPERTCVNLGYPDTDKDGVAHDCGAPGYQGHEGTDIGITFAAQDAGTAVWAAADGEVLFAFDGKYDRCPSQTEPDCQAPPSYEPGAKVGNTVCTPVGPYCGTGEPGCFWCFAGGNVIVIRHRDVPGVFATRYDHLKKGSVQVKPGDAVRRGQKIAEASSAGNSTGPHLHFEVWGTGFYELADPWAGRCGPNQGPSLWAFDPPWAG